MLVHLEILYMCCSTLNNTESGICDSKTPSGILEIRSAAPQRVRRRPHPPPLLPCHQNWSSHHHPRIQPKMERNVDAEVRKAQHMRVTRRRHHVVGAIPGRQCYASPLSLPLTNPQPCGAWSMIMTWQRRTSLDRRYPPDDQR